ncbi:hypothetical protein TNIN_198231 [Trichonephila inaurata madagascariensis]|uniref:Uncharacterized protein n=1 Tax=Trichonephila inaurata madagascariensis TaxID=2747483 RepID=A0A8X6XE69_9ARAC|nr:hypothetical protein TNIN_198231 [Trichonephila inaurata madagascariensis]
MHPRYRGMTARQLSQDFATAFGAMVSRRLAEMCFYGKTNVRGEYRALRIFSAGTEAVELYKNEFLEHYA